MGLPPLLDRKRIRDLAACRWVANGDALLLGSPGGLHNAGDYLADVQDRLLAVGGGADPRLTGARRRYPGFRPMFSIGLSSTDLGRQQRQKPERCLAHAAWSDIGPARRCPGSRCGSRG
jgi:hypothetical protein